MYSALFTSAGFLRARDDAVDEVAEQLAAFIGLLEQQLPAGRRVQLTFGTMWANGASDELSTTGGTCARCRPYVKGAASKSLMRRAEPMEYHSKEAFERTELQSQQDVAAAKQAAQMDREQRQLQRRLAAVFSVQSDLFKINQLKVARNVCTNSPTLHAGASKTNSFWPIEDTRLGPVCSRTDRTR
jgi:hypothetical protein